KQVEYANVIHSAGSDLLQLINDILDLSKVEAGRMDIHAERFPLSALLEDIQATFQPLTAEKGLDFSVEAGAEAPGELLTDRPRPVDRPRGRRPARRGDHCGERARPRQHVHLVPAV